MNQSDDRKIIERLGGATKVAELLGFKVQRVQNWMDRGIPPKMKLEYPHLFLNPNIQSRKTTAA
ncbi:hypothetical protein QLH32_04785 [Acinetobacter corruptisaponis]|uniref:Helix-turn-helix domain-containing protein n=1 Tax=Acinetobacter corruptisaponis TaxID=3045147 RepID=A0ABY8S5R7_9GAMM|nr:YdaS family helix-turn-helix protein [Acinetobacter sp. KCTC 92772]WHP06791.1 hypothetical protein QLH32_04785 [Acinetobacter sp. KCTC 92772]